MSGYQAPPEPDPRDRVDPYVVQENVDPYAGAYPVDPEIGEDPAYRPPPSHAHVRAAELWRATGIGFTLVWAVVLTLVAALWVRVAFYPSPGDELPASLRILLAPIALLAVILLVWTAVDALRLMRRRASGWDAIVVCGSFAIAVSVFIWVPGRFLEAVGVAPRQLVFALAGLGVASVVTGLLAQRAFDRAAVGFEPTEDEFEYVDDGYA